MFAEAGVSERPFYLGFYRSFGLSGIMKNSKKVCLVRFLWLFCYLLWQIEK